MDALFSTNPPLAGTFAQLGVIMQAYCIIGGGFPNLEQYNVDWNNIVKTQVNLLDDYHLEFMQAFEILEKQDYMCRRCHCLLTTDTCPTIVKTEIKSNFFSMKTSVLRYNWCCKDCANHLKSSNSTTKLRDIVAFDRKIDRYIAEEDDVENEDNAVYYNK